MALARIDRRKFREKTALNEKSTEIGERTIDEFRGKILLR
jgi:hypothetical protein